MPADDLRCPIPFDALGSSVPTANAPFDIQHENGAVQDGFHHRLVYLIAVPHVIYANVLLPEGQRRLTLLMAQSI